MRAEGFGHKSVFDYAKIPNRIVEIFANKTSARDPLFFARNRLGLRRRIISSLSPNYSHPSAYKKNAHKPQGLLTILLVRAEGFEPTTHWLRASCSTPELRPHGGL